MWPFRFSPIVSLSFSNTCVKLGLLFRFFFLYFIFDFGWSWKRWRGEANWTWSNRREQNYISEGKSFAKGINVNLFCLPRPLPFPTAMVEMVAAWQHCMILLEATKNERNWQLLEVKSYCETMDWEMGDGKEWKGRMKRMWLRATKPYHECLKGYVCVGLCVWT